MMMEKIDYDWIRVSECDELDTNHISHLILYQLNCLLETLKLIGNWRRAERTIAGKC